jgi:hypothetical protein
MTREFPEPTRLVRAAFAELQTALQIVRSDDEAAKKTLPPLSELSRPWDPPSCPPVLRRDLWRWLDQVAGWINHEYSWQADRMIPTCWPAHPHIVHELAVVASLRASAGHALTADAMEDWHRYVLPGFIERMTSRLGGSPCPPGSHKGWPGASRFTEYESAGAVTKRTSAFDSDTGHRGGATAPPPPSRNGARSGLTVVGSPDRPEGRSP